jgi:hypothetical protein
MIRPWCRRRHDGHGVSHVVAASWLSPRALGRHGFGALGLHFTVTIVNTSLVIARLVQREPRGAF